MSDMLSIFENSTPKSDCLPFIWIN